MAITKKKNSKKSQNVPDRKKLVRNQRISIALNDAEMRTLNRFFEKYKISNKAKFCRETLMLTILKRLEADTPTLFDNIEQNE
ncbi:MAG: hypothetical protein MJZ14_05785 [Paludibacteraceae bacterium]|nr:hypothetical protein [Paludibacteraceae bacterium]